LPSLLFIHGGGWRTGDKSQHRELAKSLADKGFRVFLIEYRLSTEALYPAAMLDVHDGLKYLFEHAKALKINPTNLSVAGFSAGGQMAALLGSSWNETLYGKHAANYKIHSVIDLDGILAFIHPESGEGDDSKKLSAATQYFGFAKMEGAKLWDEASALYHVSKNDPAVLFINSGVDRMHAGREDFRQKMRANNIICRAVTFPFSPHSFLLYDRWMEQVAALMADFMHQDHQVLVVDRSNAKAFQTVQAAIEQTKKGDEIVIKNGEYKEKLWIDSTKSFLTLRGESRAGVVIKFTQARDIWRCEHPDDYGAATLNIKGSDIYVQNLTIIND
jgi:pectinesterase